VTAAVTSAYAAPSRAFAERVLSALGGVPTVQLMIGAHGFVYGESNLAFQYKGSKRSNHVQIAQLEPNTLRVKFFRVSYRATRVENQLRLVSEHTTNLEAIAGVFEAQTGLRLTLTSSVAPTLPSTRVAPDSDGMFQLGEVILSRGVQDLEVDDVTRVLARHARGDWGEVSANDAGFNRAALEARDRLVSRYDIAGKTVLVETNAYRSRTTVLLAEEY
jgi:hypothetical protein